VLGERGVDRDVAVDRREPLEPHRRVRRAPEDGALERERAGLRADDGEAGRLRDQAGVEAVVALERRERAEAAVLLGRHALEHHLRSRRPRRPQRGERVHRRDHAALHVDAAAPVDEPVLDRARPRPVPPPLAPRRDDVDVRADAQPPRQRPGQHDVQRRQLRPGGFLTRVARMRPQRFEVVELERGLEPERLRSLGKPREGLPLGAGHRGDPDQRREVRG
jgi:hypothetical protein